MSFSNKKSALKQGLIRCHQCGCIVQLSAIALEGKHLAPCPRCDGQLHTRLPNSFQRTAALLCSAFVLYIPANVFPIMIVTKFGVPEQHTIISGIISLINSGMIPIAILVFIASILVPLIKMLGLLILLWAVRYRWQRNMRLLALVYRMIAFVGRWSMLDIFMISILVSIVSSEALEQVLAGSAATAFAGVVVLTMLATNSFDPRLLWDRLGAQ
ncbi:MAG: paraquat-inducible protein A [Methylococcales bacterium]